MATQTRTRKPAQKSTTRKATAKSTVKRSVLGKKIDRLVQRFQFWSTLGFWGGLTIFAATHGWVPAIITYMSHH